MFSPTPHEMSRNVRRLVAAVVVIAWLRVPVGANPRVPEWAPHDQDGAATSSASSPWIDLGPTNAIAVKPRAEPAPASRSKLAASLTLAGIYAGFMGWTYIAWYRKDCPRAGDDCPTFKWADPKKDGSWKIWKEEGWLGNRGYAGGSDKLGHAWATLALARWGTEILYQWGGYDRLTSAIIGTGLSEALFLGVELRDGTSYTFSQGDFVFNTLGAGLAFAQSVWPGVDEAVDLRVEYVPSPAYRDRLSDKGDLDIAEDYSGQTYHLVYHLGAIAPLRTWRYGSWSRYVDVTLGFETRGYKPDPLYKPNPTMCMETGELCDFDKERNLFVGLSLNVQGVFDTLLRGRSEGGRKFAHGVLEVFSVPYTTLRAATHHAVPGGEVPDEQ